MKTLSIIIPAYNEEKYLGILLQKILSLPTESIGYQKEIIVVDDGSRDSTYEVANRFPTVKVFKQIPNQGKGKAVQRGVKESTGDYLLIQDADLEYDPNDYFPLLEKLNQFPNCAIYGSRILGQIKKSGLSFYPGRHKNQAFGPWIASICLSMWTFLLYRKWISDTLTGYKIYPSEILKSFHVKTAGFETDHELTAKLILKNIAIYEVPISYLPRTKEEGKKIKMQDGFIALWTLLRFRFID